MRTCAGLRGAAQAFAGRARHASSLRPTQNLAELVMLAHNTTLSGCIPQASGWAENVGTIICVDCRSLISYSFQTQQRIRKWMNGWKKRIQVLMLIILYLQCSVFWFCKSVPKKSYICTWICSITSCEVVFLKSVESRIALRRMRIVPRNQHFFFANSCGDYW